jgi:hypothetical protein
MVIPRHGDGFGADDGSALVSRDVQVALQDDRPVEDRAGNTVARFLSVQTYQNGKNIPNDHKLYQTSIKYT